MLSLEQIEDFKKRAKEAGFSESQIANEIVRKSKEETTTTASLQPETASATTTGPQSPSMASPTATPQPSGNPVGNFVKSFIKPAVDYGKLVGEGVVSTARLASAGLNTVTGGRIGSPITGDEKPVFLSQEEFNQTAAKPLETAVKRTAGAASYVIPAGKGATLLGQVGRLAKAGAISGALFGVSEGDDITVDNILSGAVGGAAGGVVAPVGGKILGKATGLLSKSAQASKSWVRDLAARSINKATPSMWQKAVQEHGLDLNALTQKYVKAWSVLPSKRANGFSYDELLGTNTERGTGGFLGKQVSEAEQQIGQALKDSSNLRVPIDDFVRDLGKEMETLKKLPGNEGNIAAMEEFLKGIVSRYGKGITAKEMLDAKRVADSAFGRAVADEATGTAVAQAQKMFANAARNKLKTLFPAVKDALDTETEIYTLRPVLQHARAVINTQGSNLRPGSLRGKSLFELLNPFNLVDSAIQSNPNLAGKILIASSGEAGSAVGGEAASSALTSQLSGVGRTAGASVALNGVPQGSDTSTSTPDQIPTLLQSETSGVAKEEPSQPGQSPHPFGGRSKQQVLLLGLAQGLSEKELKEVASIYDMVVPQSQASDLKLSDAAIKNVNDLHGAISDVQGLFNNIAKSDLVGPIKGLAANNPYATESRNLQAEIDRVRQVVGKALEGGVLRKEDEEKYKKILPTISDTKEVALKKLQQLHEKLNQDISSYVKLQREYGKGRGAENILSSVAQ